MDSNKQPALASQLLNDDSNRHISPASQSHRTDVRRYVGGAVAQQTMPVTSVGQAGGEHAGAVKQSVLAGGATPAAAARIGALHAMLARPGRKIEFPKNEGEGTHKAVSEIFGAQVLGMDALRRSLPRPVYARLAEQMAGRGQLDRPTADAVAHAAKTWAISLGATHYTHWFQPLTNTAAEKHDSFLAMRYTTEGGAMRGEAIDAFSGAQLVQAEPDASSFPNGGARSTFEARGYTVWDTTSPMFVMDAPHGTRVLHVPSIFISYNGDALDEKTILLRSCAAVSDAALDVLRLLGADGGASHVFTTLGTEQEFFLVDRGLYVLRPDLKLAGRTLIGRLPAKRQELEDHYFGQVPSRVLSALSEAELELWRLGVPVKTRHNEVAPNQYEVAPVYEEASVAVDHNVLTMAVLRKVAHRHGLKALFHEKPFGGVNGSGKHCNWSLATDTGRNLLEPGDAPGENVAFLAMLCAVLLALKRHGGLLGAAIASSSNEHRLGANEAPPAVISAFLGEQLSAVLASLEAGAPIAAVPTQRKRVLVGSRGIDVHIAHLPAIARDATDRNRTSPFAFTGDKFEFRAVGSSQSPSFPVSMLNAAVASGLRDLSERLSKKAVNGVVSRESAMAVLAEVSKETAAVRFDGDGYSQAWRDEAKRRGLPDLSAAPDAFLQLVSSTNADMLTGLDVFSSDELRSRFNIVCERYAKELLIEGRLALDMARQHVFPAALRARAALSSLSTGSAYEERLQARMAGNVSALCDAMDALDAAVAECDAALGEHGESSSDVSQSAPLRASRIAHDAIRAGLARVRGAADALEADMPDEHYPFPKYAELLFS